MPSKGQIDADSNIVNDPKAYALADEEHQTVGHVPDQAELEGSNRPLAVPGTVAGKAALLLFEGGTKYDAFLVAASAQVGQVMMTLPHSFSETGMIPGIVLQIVCALVSIYTLYLLLILYLHRKSEMIKAGLWYDDPKDNTKRTTVTQYHEVVGFMTHPILSGFAVVIVIITAVGTCLPQVIAASSNLYILSHSLEKRTWALIFGGIMCCSVLMPSFRNMRFFAMLAIISTCYTAIFMIVTSAQNGLHSKAWLRAPQYGLQNWFDGGTTILFTFGGHYMLMEVLDSMIRPGRFHKHYGWSYPCIMFLTLPTSIFVNWAYTDTIKEDGGNAYALFPKSPQRDVSIVLMVIHISIAFMLFIMPLYIMWERVCKVHHKSMWIRAPVRLPVAGLIYFIAIMFPYYNIINGVLGAFTTSFETFVIPTLAFNWTYMFSTNRETCPKQPWTWLGKRNWTVVMIINWVIFTVVLIAGVGFGIWAAITGIIDSATQWGVFPKCYSC